MKTWYVGLLMLVLIAGAAGSPEAGKLIPPGAIKVALPDVRQPDGHSCGASALMAVCSFYGVGPRDVEGFKANTVEIGSSPSLMLPWVC
jgi:hypothetical protein